MRSDIGKVITERPRKGGMGRLKAKGYKKRLQKDIDGVKRESMKELRGGTKNFTDVLGPIKGFLRKNVGRPWDKVLSEVNAVLPAAGGVSYSHARDHLFQMVETNTQIRDGVLCDSKGIPLRTFRDEFYVCPKGFLRKAKYVSYKSNWKPIEHPRTSDGEFIIEDDRGIWFAVTMAAFAPTGSMLVDFIKGTKRSEPTWPTVFDVFYKKMIHRPDCLKRWYGEQVYATSKRQLGKREIAKYGLRKGK